MIRMLLMSLAIAVLAVCLFIVFTPNPFAPGRSRTWPTAPHPAPGTPPPAGAAAAYAT